MKKVYMSPDIFVVKIHPEHLLTDSEIPLQDFGGGSGSGDEGGDDEIEVSSLDISFE